MRVPDEDIVCRFVRAKDWSVGEDRPKPSAFKQVDLSLHEGRVQGRGDDLSDLQFDSLSGTGRAYFRAGDFRRFAQKIEECAESELANAALSVEAVWRPDTVPDAWRRWADAHAELAAPETNSKTPMTRLRRMLCMNTRRKQAPPDRGNDLLG